MSQATVAVDLEPDEPHVTVDSGGGQKYRCRLNASGPATVDVLYSDGGVKTSHYMTPLETEFARAAVARASSPSLRPPRYQANVHKPGEMAENPTGGFFKVADITPLLHELVELRAERERNANSPVVPEAWRKILAGVLNGVADIQDTIQANAAELRLTATERRTMRKLRTFTRNTGTPLLSSVTTKPQDKNEQ